MSCVFGASDERVHQAVGGGKAPVRLPYKLECDGGHRWAWLKENPATGITGRVCIRCYEKRPATQAELMYRAWLDEQIREGVVLSIMSKPKTWFEQHLSESMREPEFSADYREAKETMAFENTSKALQRYDASQADRDRLLEVADTTAAFRAWEQIEKAALDRVREAFFEDTKGVNCRDNCMIADLAFMRRCVK